MIIPTDLGFSLIKKPKNLWLKALPHPKQGFYSLRKIKFYIIKMNQNVSDEDPVLQGGN
jgi:hypothetical protein